MLLSFLGNCLIKALITFLRNCQKVFSTIAGQLNQTDHDPLQWNKHAFIEAAKHGDLDQVQALLSLLDLEDGNDKEGNADAIHSVDEQGRNALLWACENRHPKVVEFLLSKGANMMGQEANANKVFKDIADEWVCVGGLSSGSRCDWSIVAAFLDQNLKLPGPKIESYLMFAIRQSNSDMVPRLLKLGCNLDTLIMGKAALHWAVISGNDGVVAQVLKAGGKLSTVDNHGRTALYYAQHSVANSLFQAIDDQGGRGENCGALLMDGLGQLSLHIQDTGGMNGLNINDILIAWVERMVATGAELHYTDQNGQNVLSKFVSEENSLLSEEDKLALCTRLLEIDNPAVILRQGQKAILTSVERDEVQVLGLLLEKASSLWQQHVDGPPLFKAAGKALFLAVSKGRVECVKVLLEYGAPIDPGTLCAAVSIRPGLQVVKQLIENVAFKPDEYENAITIAVSIGNLAILKVLLPRCNAIGGSSSKPSALEIAVAKNHTHIVNFLLEHKAAACEPFLKKALVSAAEFADLEIRYLLVHKAMGANQLH